MAQRHARVCGPVAAEDDVEQGIGVAVAELGPQVLADGSTVVAGDRELDGGQTGAVPEVRGGGAGGRRGRRQGQRGVEALEPAPGPFGLGDELVGEADELCVEIGEGPRRLRGGLGRSTARRASASRSTSSRI